VDFLTCFGVGRLTNLEEEGVSDGCQFHAANLAFVSIHVVSQSSRGVYEPPSMACLSNTTAGIRRTTSECRAARACLVTNSTFATWSAARKPACSVCRGVDLLRHKPLLTILADDHERVVALGHNDSLELGGYDLEVESGSCAGAALLLVWDPDPRFWRDIFFSSRGGRLARSRCQDRWVSEQSCPLPDILFSDWGGRLSRSRCQDRWVSEGSCLLFDIFFSE